ncbi:unnamed protein product [Prorocentrum cordatum]|uniref:Uncharacterized protein n=1 Tax=Prorocentrum cordatum TaxID=2364126 RepID=A0ABN9S8D4_9DINO|nr:unnamed protein product [Polarella glacialis]
MGAPQAAALAAVATGRHGERQLAANVRSTVKKVRAPQRLRRPPRTPSRPPLSLPLAPPPKARRVTASLLRLLRQDRYSTEVGTRGRSFFEGKAVSDQADQLYQETCQSFAGDCGRLGPSLGPPGELDRALIEVSDEKFFEGWGGSAGHLLLATIEGLFPEHGRCGPAKLPRAHRALQGRGRPAPGQSRLPEARPAWAAVMGELLRVGCRAMAFEVVVSLVTYGRPGEIRDLKAKWITPPATNVGPFWTILIRTIVIKPFEGSRPIKVGLHDAAALWDKGGTWTTQLPRQFVRGKTGDEAVFSFACATYLKQFMMAVVMLGLPELVPCQLRHSGASRDRLRLRRTSGDIQKRARWGGRESVARCEIGGRA